MVRDIGVDLKTTFENAGTDVSLDILGAAVEILAHQLDGLRGDFLEGTAPTRVDISNDLANWVIEKDGLAIGGIGCEGDAGEIGDESVGIWDRSISYKVIIGDDFEVGSVSLAGVFQGMKVIS